MIYLILQIYNLFIIIVSMNCFGKLVKYNNLDFIVL
jgi:hypothetical protein